MNSKYNSLILIITLKLSFIIVASLIASEQVINSLPEYDEQWFRKDADDIRRHFLNKKLENQKVRMLDELSNNTIYVDGIPHIENNADTEISKMENGFRALLGMKGVKYIYKRDFYWRTWREIDYRGNKTIICYTCRNALNMKCKNCHSGGYWVIEEKPPPCPYEIMSMVNYNQICTAHYTQYNNLSDLCPTLMNLNDLLANCRNPIETEWKITRKYNDHYAEKTLAVICGGRDSCRIFTSYTVLPDSILFRIINETNHVIYSRVMKNSQRNYVCVEDCGVLDNATKSVIKLEKPFILNLLDYASHKSKREDNTVTTKTVTTTEKIPKAVKERKLLFLSKNMLYNKYLHKTVAGNKKSIVKFITSNSTVNKVESITKTLCKKLEDSFRKAEDSDTKEDN